MEKLDINDLDAKNVVLSKQVGLKEVRVRCESGSLISSVAYGVTAHLAFAAGAHMQHHLTAGTTQSSNYQRPITVNDGPT